MILNSDREDEGFQEGLRQARAKEHKDHRTKGLLKAALLPFDHSHQSFMRGLERGYAKGLEEREVTHKVAIATPPAQPARSAVPTSSTSTTMKDSIGYQLEALGELQRFLQNLAATLSDAAQQYHRALGALGESGMVERIIHRYEQEFMTPNLHHIRSLIDRIQTEDVPYILREIEHMEGAGRQ